MLSFIEPLRERWKEITPDKFGFGSSHNFEPVLTAMGLPEDDAGSAIRISLGWNSQTWEVDQFVTACYDLLAGRPPRLTMSSS